MAGIGSTLSSVSEIYGQGAYAVRFDWGPTGAAGLAADVAVIVDVLSFSTTVTVAVERGTRVFPYPWKDARAATFAADHGAVLAVGRLEASKIQGAPPSLSPASLLAGEPVSRLVLPSPNGSTIAAILSEGGSSVVVGCLRNATAVARWLSTWLDGGRSVAVIAAGERWVADDSLRPALEDQLGAGAIVSGLIDLGYDGSLSPEARAAAELFRAARSDLTSRLQHCVGGRELASAGFGSDVDVAADLDASDVVPMLKDEAFGRAD